MSLESNLSKLPEACYSVSEAGDLIQLHRNRSGYFPSVLSSLDKAMNRALADQLNANLSVTKAQEQAMYAGSMFGFHVPAADPDRYDVRGIPKQELKTPELEDDERAYVLNGGEYYLHIQTYEEGYDYTIYHRDFSEYDGGQLDVLDFTMDEAVQDILKGFGMQDLSLEVYDPDALHSYADEVALAQLDAARAAQGIRPLTDQISDAQNRSVHQSRGGPGKEPERS